MKRLVSVLVSLALVFSLMASICTSVGAYTFSMSKTTGHTVKTGVSYAKYNVTSKVNGNTLACTTLTFNPSSGYIPMSFQAYAGTSGTVATHYSQAVNKYGYDVAGVINGSFFSMGTPYGTLTGINISNGKIAGAHLGWQGSVVAFGSDGSMKIVDSALSYVVNIGGKNYYDMIYYINKTSGSASASNWSERLYYFDTSCGSKCDTYSVCPGTEILCKKVDNTDLAVGQTLVGEVISVTSNTYGGSLGASGAYSDNFILFMRAGSSYESMISGVKAGDKITISTTETISASRTVMENANSVIPNVGWLVKDGVDRTLIDSTIGTHSVTLQARWTAFGTKADGTYVFFTSEGGSTGSGGSLTLRDVAQAMINMGCTNVVRMDGGGSSAMYVSNTGSGSAGYVQSSTRSVADGVLIVSRASATKSAVKSALLTEINQAETLNASFSMPALTSAITNAKAVYNASTSIMGDHKREIMRLQALNSGKAVLENALSSSANLTISSYSDLALDRIDYAYLEGKRVLNYASSTETDMINAAKKLISLTADKSNKYNRLSLGAKYAAPTSNPSYLDVGVRELTDGALFGKDATSSQWTGYQLANATGANSKGSYVDVMVDLGEAKRINGFGVSVAHLTGWGISAPTTIEVYCSKNGIDYYHNSTLSKTISTVDGQYQVIPYENVFSATSTDRYVVFRIYFASSHLFVGEVSVYGEGGNGRSDFSAYNKRIATDETIIFTDGFGAANHTNANLTWAKSAVCAYDNSKGAYVVQSIVAPNGATDYSYTVPTGGIIIGMHGASASGNANVATLAVGDIVYLTGLDVVNGAFYPGARLTYIKANTNTVTYTTPNIAVVDSTSGAKSDSDGYVMLPTEKMSSADVANLFVDSRLTVNGVATGSTVTMANGTTYTLYIVGDLNGDSMISALDYLQMTTVLKKQATSTGAYFKAADFDESGALGANDCIALKVLLKN